MSTNEHYTWFITGANRGIGLELTKQLLELPQNTVIAACRNLEKADNLKSLTASAGGRLHILRLEATDKQTIKEAAEATSKIVGEQGLDYLINNAGYGVYDTAFTVDIDDLVNIFRTNVAGPAYISQTFAPLVEKSKKKTIGHISSNLGSIATESGPVLASYSVSKAALNMLACKQARERPDLIVIALHPGHLQTELGGPSAPLHVSVGVAGVIKVLTSGKQEYSGSFIDFNGERLPW